MNTHHLLQPQYAIVRIHDGVVNLEYDYGSVSVLTVLYGVNVDHLKPMPLMMG